MPRLTHPNLDGVVIDVDESKARNRRDAGWVDADPGDHQPIDTDGVDDHDASNGDVEQTATDIRED